MTESNETTNLASTTSTRLLLHARNASAVATTKEPLFLSDPGVPRRRRPSDVARLITAAAAFVLLGWAASSNPPLDARVLDFFSDLPDWIRTLSWVAFSGAGLTALLLL